MSANYSKSKLLSGVKTSQILLMNLFWQMYRG